MNNDVIFKYLLLLNFMKFLDWNENKIDINLLKTQFVLRFLYLPGSSQTDVPANIKRP